MQHLVRTVNHGYIRNLGRSPPGTRAALEYARGTRCSWHQTRKSLCGRVQLCAREQKSQGWLANLGHRTWRTWGASTITQHRSCPAQPHPQLPQLRAGVKDHALRLWEEIPPDGNHPWRAVWGEKSGPRTRMGLLATDGPRPEHSL